MKRIVVDMFGADGGPEVVVRGAARALAAQKEADLVLAGSSVVAQMVLFEEASRMNLAPGELMQRASVIETNSFVTARENPKNMVKDRADTSMVLSFEALRDDPEIAGLVTCGNTGCALVSACFHLGLEKGLLQPALAAALPRSAGGYTVLLDCGANLEPKARDYADYARLGAALCRNAYEVSNPAVGLLNVGSEREKGNALLQEAFERIDTLSKEEDFSFIGNMEGTDLLSGRVDVAVCDGFTGNVLLKSLESAGLIAAQLAEEGEVEPSRLDPSLRQIEDPLNRNLRPEGVPAPERIRRFFGYNAQAGAIFLGTKKPVIKAHGAATEETVCSCILQAIRLGTGKD